MWHSNVLCLEHALMLLSRAGGLVSLGHVYLRTTSEVFNEGQKYMLRSMLCRI